MRITQQLRTTALRGTGLMLLLSIIFGGVTPPALVQAANAAYGACQNMTLPVAMGPGQTQSQTLAGTYCTPTTWAHGAHKLDVLVHGATYNRSYWDWPVDPATYSYVDKDLQAGRAVFYYDRLGAGASSHPNGITVTIQADAYALHQVIQHFRSAQQYTNVNIIGHSIGSMIAIEEVGNYHDASSLVVTSALHIPGLGLGSSALVTQLYPASLDPQFSGNSLLDGYLTTRPGGRSTAFYGPHNVDPSVLAYDEAHKDLFSVGQDATGLPVFELPPLLNAASRITVPVLIVQGAEDGLFCGLLVDCTNANAIRTNESLYYLATPQLDAISIPGTGHDIGLHTTAPQSFANINTWLRNL